MSPRKFSIFLTVMVLVLAACQPKNPRRTSLRDGRNLRGDAGDELQKAGAGPNISSQGACGSYSVPGKKWGEVTGSSGDQAFMQEIGFLMSPVLAQVPKEDQLGYVSSASNQTTGVRFWGHAQSIGGNGLGQIDSKSAEIRIEIFDSNACQSRADGSIRPMIPIHISSKFADFRQASGNISSFPGSINRTAYLYFEDKYGAIILNGTIDPTYFSGTISYTVTGSSGQRTLGRFKVSTCGFFVCSSN